MILTKKFFNYKFKNCQLYNFDLTNSKESETIPQLKISYKIKDNLITQLNYCKSNW